MRGKPIVCFATAWVVMVGLAGCGGGGGGSSGSNLPGGSIGVSPMWPQPDGSSSSVLPDAVKTLRVVFQSNTGYACCLAVDPLSVPINAGTGQRALVLDQLPPGSGTFQIAGFSTDFAPAVDGVTSTCATLPPGVGEQCDATRPATAAFESDPISVSIVPGALVHGSEVDIHSLPFAFDLNPDLFATSASPVSLHFTAADATSGIAEGSIAAEVLFRSLSKRSPLTLSPCDDGGSSPCSQEGALKVKGFRAVGAPLHLPEGPAEVHITAQSLSTPPRALDFTYPFTVFPGTSSVDAAIAAAAGSPTSVPLHPSAALPPRPSDSGAQASGTPADSSQAPATSTPIIPLAMTPTPTATPTPIEGQ